MSRAAHVARAAALASLLWLTLWPGASATGVAEADVAGPDVADTGVADIGVADIGVADIGAADIGAAVTAEADTVGAASFRMWAKRSGQPLRTVEPGGDARDLAALVPIVKGARVIALGEPGHGAHEPLALRNRIIRFMVEEQGLRAIALETGFTEAWAINDFVQGGAGDAPSLVRENLSWGFGHYEENVQLVTWMRDFNRAHEQKVRFYGMDMSGADDEGSFPNARVAVDAVTAYLERIDRESSLRARHAVQPYLSRFSERAYSSLTSREKSEFSRALIGLKDHLRRHERRLIQASSASELERHHQNLVVAQALASQFELGLPVDAPTLHAEDWRLVNIRDGAMAANVRWTLEQEGAGGRVLVFAHIGHVMSARLRGGMWTVFSQAPKMMGLHLRDSFGEGLRVIAMLGANSSGGLPQAPLPATNVEALMQSSGVPLMLLDLRRAAGATREWLQQVHPVRANFVSWMDVEPAQGFDALVFIDRLSPASTAVARP